MQVVIVPSVAGLQVYVYAFCSGVGRTTALWNSSSSPGCHGSQRLLLGVWHNPTGRTYAVVYFCVSVGFGRMKAAKVGKVIHIFRGWKHLMCIETHKCCESPHTHQSTDVRGFFFRMQEIKMNNGLEVMRRSYYSIVFLSLRAHAILRGKALGSFK